MPLTSRVAIPILRFTAWFLSFGHEAKKNKQAANTANVKRQLQSLRNNLKLCTLDEGEAPWSGLGPVKVAHK